MFGEAVNQYYKGKTGAYSGQRWYSWDQTWYNVLWRLILGAAGSGLVLFGRAMLR